MEILNYTKTRGDFASTIDRVVDNNETVIITKKDKSAVLISLDEYNSWQETNHLLSSINNATRLKKSIKQVEENKLLNQEILEK